MGIDDKVRHAAEDVKGKIKEGVGKLADDERLETEGQADQAKAAAKKAVDKAADEAERHARAARDKIRDVFQG